MSRLVLGTRREAEPLRALAQPFTAPDATALVKEMTLDRLGTTRGASGDPPTDATGPDEVERRLLARIEADKARAHALFVDSLRTTDERLANLDFEGRFAEIRQAAPSAVSEFKAEAATGRDELNRLRRALKEHEEEKEAFKRAHGLWRTPRPPSLGAQVLKFGLLLIVLVAETVLNGSFLAKGSELGLLGGTSEAFAFALLNVFASFLIGRIGLPQLEHRNPFRKLLGFLALAFWLVFAIALNLALAHYREVSGLILETGGSAVVDRLATAPLQLADVKSWLFFAIGLFFAVVALIDGYATVDPYPGFGDLQTRLDAAHRRYIDRKQDLIDRLLDVRDDYTASLEEANRDLAVRRAEVDQIMAGRERLARLFTQHQIQLQKTLDVALAAYREANRKARRSPPPAHFAQGLALDLVDPAVEMPDRSAEIRLIRERVSEAQALLIQEVGALHATFDAAVAGYHQIDDLVREERHGAAA